MRFESGLRAAFFCLLLSWVVGSGARAAPHESPVLSPQDLEGRAADPVWQALLHMDAGRPRVLDPGFLLAAGPGWSPYRELLATRELLARDPQAHCRFPARAQWLQDQGLAPSAGWSACEAIQEFLRRAPAERIDLVFAAENVRQPASIMGHLFLRLSGHLATDGRPVAHAVSFFTDADSLNLPRLLYESLVTGKPGFFTLSPYAEAEQQYLHREMRSLWIYRLQLDPADRTLLLLHLHELRLTRLTYFFQGYNCATLLKHVLAVVRPGVLAREDPWTTPKDVLKHADAVGLIAHVETLAPPDRRIRELVDALPADRVGRARRAIATGQISIDDSAGDGAPSARAFLNLQLQRAYVEALRETGPAPLAREAQAAELERVLQTRYAGYRLDLAAAKDPRAAPGDTQYGLGLAHGPQGLELRVDVLPVSHRLVDFQPGASVETGLALLELGLRQPLDRRHGPRLRRLGLYAMESLIPHDPLVGGFSGRFQIALDDEDPAVDTPRLHGVLGGAIGLSHRLHRDLDVYGLVGLDLMARAGLQLRPLQELGLLIRGAYRMKTVLGMSFHQGLYEGGGQARVLRWRQSWVLGPEWTLDLQARRTISGSARWSQTVLQLRRIF